MLLIQATEQSAAAAYANADYHTLVMVVVGATALIFIVALVVFAAVAKAAFQSQRPGAPTSLGLLFQRSDSLRLATVIIVVLAVVYLAIVDKLNDGAIAILSGIVGYVLGTSQNRAPSAGNDSARRRGRAGGHAPAP